MRKCILYNAYYLSYTRRDFRDPFSERFMPLLLKVVCADPETGRRGRNPIGNKKPMFKHGLKLKLRMQYGTTYRKLLHAVAISKLRMQYGTI